MAVYGRKYKNSRVSRPVSMLDIKERRTIRISLTDNMLSRLGIIWEVGEKGLYAEYK